ncbi:cytochrome C oxidase subunit IV family protein [Aquihabitans sp. G128]|uniref:cytochrome C oxidase subunit IV family protein n=1 Tax=Aquihabitans sp. G128 TaxID=2849779 RepID=UPI001C228978|nr:cytochrome C oxidase subunit IV family protein [Aquihabitans sp. G128]QXC59485.1 cytochrome C oxidase subunit IV family protein [Aquihabitans sp. G128]
MTDTSAPLAPPVGQGHGADAHHSPTDGHYYRIAIGLAVITGIEVAWSYLPTWDGATGLKAFIEVAGLLVMMAIKFVVVAAQFMHLKFDDKLLSRVFYAGLVLAIFVYIAALTTFQIFSSAPNGYR